MSSSSKLQANLLVFWQEIDDDLETCFEEGSLDELEGNKDAARALMRVKQKLDGYEGGEMRSLHGQVVFLHFQQEILDIQPAIQTRQINIQYVIWETAEA